jgi:hypothetical protein
MQLRGEQALYFATDLTNFLACRHLAAVERLSAHGGARRPLSALSVFEGSSRDF